LYFSGRNIDPLKTKRISFIQGSSGVNIIRAYTDDSNVNNATIAFIRNDGKQLGEFTMVHVTLDDDGVTAVNAYQIPLTDNLGALEVAGELGFTVYLKTVTVDAGGVSTTKTQATGKATAHVYDSVTKSDQISPDQAELEQLRESVEQIPSRVETAVATETAGMNGEIDANAAAIAKEASDRQEADALKVDKEAGKSLISDTEITRLALVDNYDDTTLSGRVTAVETSIGTETTNRQNADNTLQENIDLKVSIEAGKELIPTTELTRLASVDNYDDTALSGRVTTVETKVNDLSSPLDNLGVSGEVVWDNQAYNATVQQMIDDYVKYTLTMDTINFSIGDVIIINNKSTTPLTLPLHQSLVETGGYWLWEYDGSHWYPAVKFPNTFTNDLTNELKALYDSAYQFSQSHTNPTKVSQLENDSSFTDLTLGTQATQAYFGDLGNIAYQFSQNHTNPIEAVKVNGVALTPTNKAVDITITPFDNTSNDTRLTAIETQLTGIETLLGGI
jgi:hypothetical protein